mgnify:CR=1 FL=1
MDEKEETAKPKTADEDLEQALEDGGGSIGINQFFIAKRAAKKMIEYLREMQKREADAKENNDVDPDSLKKSDS